MPSGQNQSSTISPPTSQAPITVNTSDQLTSGTIGPPNKSLPPPNKLPPPPPPPPKDVHLLPPAAPPRNASQLVGQSNPLANQFNSNITSSPPGTHNSGSTLGLTNSASRCTNHGHQATCATGLHQPPVNQNQRGFSRHGDCGSRSSMSSHGSSLSHHYHVSAGAHNAMVQHNSNVNINLAGANNNLTGSVQCNLQPNVIGCGTWSTPSNAQLGRLDSSNLSDNGNCNIFHHVHDSKNSGCIAQYSNCCSHRAHASITKCSTNISGISSQPTATTATTVSGHCTFYPNRNDTTHLNHATDSYCTNSKTHAQGGLMLQQQHHHHHHHASHNVQAQSAPFSPSDNAPVCASSYHRCGHVTQSIIQGESKSSPMHLANEPGAPKTSSSTHQCGHIHRTNAGSFAHHQTVNCFEHGLISDMQQLSMAHCNCLICPHTHSEKMHHDCNTNPTVMMNSITGSAVINDCPYHYHHHGQPPSSLCSSVPKKCVEAFNSETTASSTTAHVHNLSNSSTTTHTSNVAIKHPMQQSHHQGPVLNHACRSSSQQYEQYGLSSAASTASVSSCQQNALVFDDSMPQTNLSKIHQPLPPAPAPPPPPPHLHNAPLLDTKSRPSSPSQHNLNYNTMNINSRVLPSSESNVINNNSGLSVSQQLPQHMVLSLGPLPPPPPLPLSSPLNPEMYPLPPLPPKPISPTASPCSTQITTVRTSPSLQNQPITRITTQAGVQGQLPTSDVPPPLPPLNSGFRTQPLINDLMTKITSASMTSNEIQEMSSSINEILNFNRGGSVTDAERKTELLTRQVEQEMEHRLKSGESLGICPKCCNKVMPSQEACKAMNQIFHSSCFVCSECGRTLIGKTFYPVGDRVYCEEDFQYTGHMKSLEKCAACSHPIFKMILPAMGKSYHPKCFKCCICHKCLDGVPFTIDRKNNIYCVRDYHEVHSPKCAACGKSISPIDGTGETVRVVSNDKDYHVDCYCCEDCGLQLTDEEPSRSYPLDDHLLCQKCHINRLTTMKAALSLN